MTFSKADWELSPQDLEQLDKMEVNLHPYQAIPTGVESPILIPPLAGGVRIGTGDLPKPSNIKGNQSEWEPFASNPLILVQNEQPSSLSPSPILGETMVRMGMRTSPTEGVSQSGHVPQHGRFFNFDDLAQLPAPTWLIEDVLPKDVVSMLFGPPASLKSFLGLDWMLHLAIGRTWNGHKVVEGGMKVLYLLGEGKNNLYKRVAVWVQHHQLTEEELNRLRTNFFTTFVMPQVRVPKNINTLINDMNNESFEPVLLVFDTFARAFVGGDDNSSQETGEAMAQFDRLRDRGHTILFIHHTIKKGKIYRGSLNLEAAVDTAFSVVRDKEHEELSLFNSKQKDNEEITPMKMGWKKIFLDLDQKLDSLVLIPISDVPIADQILALPFSQGLSRGDVQKMVKGVSTKAIMEILDQLLVDGQLVESKDGKRKMIDRPQFNPNV